MRKILFVIIFLNYAFFKVGRYLKAYWQNIDLIKSKEKKTKNGFLPVGHLDDQGDLEVPKTQIGFKRLSQKKTKNVI